MVYDKCPICDEKLENGVCPMCGYDFKRLEHGGKPLPVHDKKRHTSKAKKKSGKSPRQFRRNDFPVKKKKGKGKSLVVVITAILFFLVDILPDVAPFFMNQFSEVRETIESKISGEKSKSDTTQPEIDPYRNAEYKLKTTGKHFETSLTAGEYIVGLDLPEGIYQVSIAKGKNSLDIKNRKQSISQYDFYKKDADKDDTLYHTKETVHLYQGSYVKVDQGGTMKFVTDSGQTGRMKTRKKNSLKKKITLTEGTKTAGVDFPAGSYDMICQDGRGRVETKYRPEGSTYDVSEGYELESQPNKDDMYAYPEKQNQVYFNDGMKIEVPAGMKLVLRPSVYTIPKEMKIYRYYEPA